MSANPVLAIRLATAIAELRAALDDPVAPVALLVPSEATGVLARQTLAAAGAYLNVRVLAPPTLVLELAWRRIARTRTRPEPGWLHATLAASVPALAAAGSLGRYGATLAAPGWAGSAARAIATLESAGLDAPTLAAAAADAPDPDRVHLLAALLAAIERARATHGVAGPRALHKAATEAALAGESPTAERITAVLVLGDRELAPGAHDAVAAWCARRPTWRIAPPPTDALDPIPWGLAAASGAAPLPWEPAVSTGRDVLAARLFRPTTGAARAKDDATLAFTTAADDAREMADAVREVLRAIERGTPLERIAIALPSGESADVLAAALEDAGVPATWLTGPPLSRSPTARLLRLALELAPVGAGDTARWYDLLRQGILDLRPALAPSVVARRGRWRRILARGGAGVGAAAISAAIRAWRNALDPAAPEAAFDRQSADALALALDALPKAIAPFDAVATLADHAARWRVFLRTWVRRSEDRARIVALLESWEGSGAGPPLTREAAIALLDEALAATPALDGKLTEPKVRVAPPAALLGGAFELVVATGLVEGKFPAKQTEDELVPDTLVAHLASVAGARLHDSFARRTFERHRLGAVVACGVGRVVLSRARADESGGRAHLPSSLLLDAASAVLGHRATYSELESLAKHAPGRGTLAPADPEDALSRGEHLRSRLVRDPRAALPALVAHPVARRLLALQRSVDRVRAALMRDEVPPLDPHSGRVPPGLVPALGAEPRSARAFADAIQDPSAYFFRHVLGAWPAPALPRPPALTERWANARALVAAMRALASGDGAFAARFDAAWRAHVGELCAPWPADPAELAIAEAIARRDLARMIQAKPDLDALTPRAVENGPVPGLGWSLAHAAPLVASGSLVRYDAGATTKQLEPSQWLPLAIEALALGTTGEAIDRLEVVSAGGTRGEATLAEVAGELAAWAREADARVAAGLWPATHRSTFLLQREAAIPLGEQVGTTALIEAADA